MSRSYRCRASAFAGLFDCAYRWEGAQLLGMRSPNSPRALLGTATHAGTAAFDTARMIGAPISIDDAAGAAVDALHEREAKEGVEWCSGEPNRKEVERIALTLTAKYCREVSPKFTFEAVELETKPLAIDCGGGVVIELAGTLDRMRLRKSSTGRSINDVKTGAKAVSEGRAATGKHRPQLGIYELLAEHTLGVTIDEPASVTGMNTGGDNAIAITSVSGCRELLVGRGGDGDPPGLIEIAASQFRAGLFPPNTQSQLCSPRYCQRWDSCIYHE